MSWAIFFFVMENLYLMHFGIKGQKWGVRRYQNADGSLTAKGKKQALYRRRTMNAAKTKNDVEDIVSTFSKKDRKSLNLDKDQKEYMTYEEGSNLVKRFVAYHKKTPVAFFDIIDSDGYLMTSVGTRNDSKYRGKGYASKVTKQGTDWYMKNKSKLDDRTLNWSVLKDNTGSRKTAEKNGYELAYESKDDPWATYVKY